ncbi:hypothetical protein Misp06_02191 [Microbulbifer sp. NBRC 101763]
MTDNPKGGRSTNDYCGFGNKCELNIEHYFFIPAISTVVIPTPKATASQQLGKHSGQQVGIQVRSDLYDFRIAHHHRPTVNLLVFYAI